MTVEQNESLESVLNRFLPFFKKKQERSTEMTLATSNEIYLETKANVSFEDEESSWSTVLQEFYDFLSNFEGSFDTHVHLIFPMICQPLDDYRSKNRLTGLSCVKHFLCHTNPKLIASFRIQHVLYESFKTSISFDDDELLKKSLASWVNLISLIEEFGSKDFLAQCDQILLLACREVELGKSEERRVIFLDCLLQLIPLMSHFAIRYLRKVIATLCEVQKESSLLETENVMKVVIQFCWPRIDSSLRSLILESFPSLESFV